MSSSSLVSSSFSGATSHVSKMTSSPSPRISSPQSSSPGSVILNFFFTLMPNSFIFARRTFALTLASVGRATVLLNLFLASLPTVVVDASAVPGEGFRFPSTPPPGPAIVGREKDTSSWMAWQAVLQSSFRCKASPTSVAYFKLILFLHSVCSSPLPYQSMMWSGMDILH